MLDKFLEALDDNREIEFVEINKSAAVYAWKDILKAYMIAVSKQGKDVEGAVQDEVREILEDIQLEGRLG